MIHRRGNNASSGAPSPEKGGGGLFAAETRKTLQQPLLPAHAEGTGDRSHDAAPRATADSGFDSDGEGPHSAAPTFQSSCSQASETRVSSASQPRAAAPPSTCRASSVFAAPASPSPQGNKEDNAGGDGGRAAPAESDLEAPAFLPSSAALSEDAPFRSSSHFFGDREDAGAAADSRGFGGGRAERFSDAAASGGPVVGGDEAASGRERFREYSEWVVRGGCRLSSALWNVEEEAERGGLLAAPSREAERGLGAGSSWWRQLKGFTGNAAGGRGGGGFGWRRGAGRASASLDPVSISLPTCALLGGAQRPAFSSFAAEQRPRAGEGASSLSLLGGAAGGSGTPQRVRKFRVVEIEGGVCRRLEVQTPELLRMVHLHNARKELRDLMVGALKLRDLRQVVSPSGGGRPSIEVRRNCVLVNMPYVRCIILYQRVLLLPPSRCFVKGFSLPASTVPPPVDAQHGASAKNFQLSDLANLDDEGAVGALERRDHQYELLISKLVHLSELKRAGPFEFAVLEAVLVHVCDELIAGLAPLKRAADSILEAFHRQPSSTRRLRQISELKRRLGGISERASGVARAIKELLNEEDDMTRLELSRFWHSEDAWETPSKTATAEDAEILLECYEQEVEAIFQVVVRTEDALDDALQLMELHLASTRNAFLKTEIALDVLGAFFGFVAAVAGIFGMNIRSGWEEKTNVFWGVTVAFSLAGAATFALLLCWFRTQKL